MQSIVDRAVSSKSKAAVQAEDKISEFGMPRIMVMGCGGAGSNAANRIANMNIEGASLVAINTDKQHLALMNDDITKLLIGKSITRGLGAGGYPEVGEKAAESSREALEELLRGTDLLFITAGMGGGTGTGCAPVVARIAREQGSIVVAMVTYPFSLERARTLKADDGLTRLKNECNTVIVIDNNRLVQLVPNLPIQDAFKVADEVISRTVRGITETITQPSLINIDYADIRSVMTTQTGISMIAVGEAMGNQRCDEVVKDTLGNSLLDVDISGAKGALVHITGGTDLTLGEANEIGNQLTEFIDAKANVIWGARVDPNYDSKIEVIAIFTDVTCPFLKNSEAAQQKKEKDQFGLDDIW